MTTCVIRTVLIYVLLVLIIRLTGKRQIGELEISELVSTILISEIAASPVANQEIPISFAVIPILLIVSMEVIISFLSTKCDWMKKVFIGAPTFLIRRGKIQPRELKKARVSLEELLAALRQSGVAAVNEVGYAILESNGKLSVLPRAAERPATPKNLSLNVTETGIAHAVIIDGVIKDDALHGANRDRAWLEQEMKKAKRTLKEIFLFTVDDTGKVYIVDRKDRT